MADLSALRDALALPEAAAAAALAERAARVVKKFGGLLLDTSGMTQAGVERKASARALFAKLQFLTEGDGALVGPEAAATVDLKGLFGATEDDAARLRIASLYDVDLDAALALPSAMRGGEEEGGEGGGEEA